MKDVLAGVRVLDFGRYIAGPYCAMLLGDFGADVIRIEKRTGGEDRFQAPLTAAQDGALFMQMNRGKRGMTLDPMTPDGREVVRRLVATADVVVANLPPQTLAAMRLDYDSLTAARPDVILATVNAYGRGGPYSDRVGFDSIGQVMSGAAYMTSEGAGERPFRFQAPWVDFGTALHCAYGVAMALMARRDTGRGQVVEGALLPTALTVANSLLIEQEVLQINRVPTGNRGQTSAPSDIFRTRDGWVLAQAIGEPLFRRWARLMGEDYWLTDPRFKDDISRGNHGTLISARMAAWCAARTSAEALEALGKASLPAAPVLKPQQALDDPHVKAMAFFQPVDYPGLPRPAPLAKTPVRLSETPAEIRNRAPTLGEHTDAILAEIGYAGAEIAELREKGAV
jgi:crotonobetainyl-CoA:carnitine CoA-transferase CaiB-like acyl-CoA transferase